MKKRMLLTATAVATFATSSLLAQMNMDGMNMGGMDMNHSAHQHGSDTQTTLPEPAKTVFANYIKIQADLAQDFMQDLHDAEAINDRSLAIAKAVREDSAQTFPADVAQQAEALAKATDLKTAREAFKPLSESLIKYLDAHKDQAGQFEKIFCSMASAKWLQKTGSGVNNPYLGKSMSGCGQIQN